MSMTNCWQVYTVYKFQSMSTVCLLGDFNSRCGDLKDYIEGVDAIGDREVMDFQVNYY